MKITSLDAPLGAVVSGIDLSQPLDAASASALRKAWLDNIILVFHDQDLSDPQLLAFARHFGALEFPPSRLLNYSQGSGQKDDIPPEVNVISNVVENGKKIGQLGAGEARWHTDSSFVERPPSASILHALELPPSGGNTSFMDMYAALESLPQSLRRRIEGRSCKHDCSHTSDGVLRRDFASSRDASECPGPSHPLIRTHPETGRKSLYIGSHTQRFAGMKDEESDGIIKYLRRHAIRPEFTCRFRWDVGSLALWDNRCVQHYAINDYHGHRRRAHRITIRGDTPF